MIRTTVRTVIARLARLLSTGIAVILGVAFMAGTLVLTDTISRSFDQLATDTYAGTDAHIRSISHGTSGGMTEQRRRLDEDLISTIAHVDGVATADGNISGIAQIFTLDGRAVGGSKNGPPALGMSWSPVRALNPFRIAQGRTPAAGDEVVIDRGAATKARISTGDRITVATASGTHEMRVVGIARFGSSDSPAGASAVLFTPEAAQGLLGEPGMIDTIDVVAEAGVSQHELAARIARVLPEGTEVLTGAELTATSRNDIHERLGFFNTFLITFAVIALFVGAFIISNTFSILVAQRSKETALLRALGATRRQVLASVLAEAVVVGTVASVAGLIVGIGLAVGLQVLLEATGLELPAQALVVTRDTLATSVLAGVIVTVVAAVGPAIRSTRVAPVEAMRSSDIEPHQEGRSRTLAGVLLSAVGLATMATGLFGSSGIAAVGSGAMATFIGIAALGPIVGRPVTRLLAGPLRLRGVPGHLAGANALRNPRRTSNTASALMVGVSLVTLMAVLASSTRASVDAAVTGGFTGDLVVDSSAGLPVGLVAEVAAVPSVTAAVPVRLGTVYIGGTSTQLVSAPPDSIRTTFDLGRIDGDLGELGVGEIALSATEATNRKVDLGDRIGATFAETGEQDFVVGAIYEKDGLAGPALVTPETFEANVTSSTVAKVFVSTADDERTGAVQQALTRLLEDYPQAELLDKEAFREAQVAGIDQMLNLVYGLLLLAVLIALIGIANALGLAIHERTREIGLLRAVGMTRAQVRATVRWESVIVALLGTVLGLVIGTGFAVAIVDALRSEGIDHLAMPVRSLVAIAAFGAAAGVLAGVLPARRAAKLDILQAVNHV